MAVTRVTIAPKEGGPNDSLSIHSQSGQLESRKFSGSGSDTDIMTSSARAYVSALNKLLTWNARRSQQHENVVIEDTIQSESVAAEPMEVSESAPWVETANVNYINCLRLKNHAVYTVFSMIISKHSTTSLRLQSYLNKLRVINNLRRQKLAVIPPQIRDISISVICRFKI